MHAHFADATDIRRQHLENIICDVLSAAMLVLSAWHTLLYRARTGDDVARRRLCPRSGTTHTPASASRG